MNIKGLIFDYGGTIDTNGCHWAEAMFLAYRNAGVLLDKSGFREAYVHAERTLALQPLISPTDDFLRVLILKIGLQLDFLKDREMLQMSPRQRDFYLTTIVDGCYQRITNTLQITREVVAKCTQNYPAVLVSNFYGNINRVLEEFQLLPFFKTVIESSVVGVRKPNPEIFSLGVKALSLPANEVCVIGDSFDKDILPAHSLGCKTVWLRGKGWNDKEEDVSIPDAIITNLNQLPELLK